MHPTGCHDGTFPGMMKAESEALVMDFEKETAGRTLAQETDPIYVCGHRNPDADSILSAVAVSELCRRRGHPAIACRAGSMPADASWLLERFGFETPRLLEDARLKLSETQLAPALSCRETDTIFTALERMSHARRPYLAVTDARGRLKGMVTRNDLATIGVQDTALGIRLLKTARLEDIVATVDGTLVVSTPLHIDGRVSIVALSYHSVSRYEVRDRIVIVGDDPEAQLRLIEEGAGLLVLVWAESVAPEVQAAALAHECPVILAGHGSMNTSRYLYFSVQVRHVMTPDPIVFDAGQFVSDAIREMRRHRYRAYPVLDQGILLGFLEMEAALNFSERRMIRVDHNEDSQSVKNGSQAQVLAVIDHHRIGGFSSAQPVFFRCEIVGSTCLVAAQLFLETGLPIDKDLAGLLLGGMICDTLGFRSPTTTDQDRQMADWLEFRSGLDASRLEEEILARTGTEDLAGALEDDLKQFDLQGQDVRISQILTGRATPTALLALQKAMDVYCAQTGCQLLVSAVTILPENGSCLLAAGDLADRLGDVRSLPEIPRLQEGMLSRKKQILPLVMEKVIGF